jgi:hypothetical protein
MTTPLGFDDLKDIVHRRIDLLPDHRTQGPNTRDSVQDAALGAFGIFFTPSPSFLDDQRHLQQTKGQNNACTLFGVETIPCNNQRRNLLDPMMPRHLDGVYLAVCEGLEQHGSLASFRVLSDQLLMAMDGTQYFSSKAIHCQNCLRRQTSHSQTLYSHSAITPVIICPGRSEVMALPPECIMPQDGHDTQDCERVAGKRWMDTHAKHVAPHGITLLGDDLYSHQPLCKLALDNGLNFIFVCKPDSHATLYERLAFWQANDAIKELETRRRHGCVTAVTMYRSMNDVFLRDGPGAVAVHWLEITSVHAKTGEQLSHNSFLTTHRLSAENVSQVAQAGRGRWKVENENNHVLKTKGYHIEHNFGHGKKYLAAFLLSLNLLAFLFHTVLQWCDDKYALLRQVLVRRQTFFDDIRALTRSMVFESWHHLMDFMIRGLELEARLEAKLEAKLDTS